MKKVLIKNGMIATKNYLPIKDLLIEDGKIAYIGEIDDKVEVQDCEVIDATGLIIFPGFIDGHTHFDMDAGSVHTADDFYTGTKAALRGGTTCVIDFATQEKGETLQQALQNWHEKASGKSSCHYGFHMAITDWNNEVEQEIKIMKNQGVTSFKLYMAYESLRMNDAAIYDILKTIGAQGGVVGMHCENGDLINVITKELLAHGCTEPKYHPMAHLQEIEAEAIGRFLDIAHIADVPVHIVHLTGEQGLERIRAARMRGQKVWVETCPQYLILDHSKYLLSGFESAKYVLSPPLRSLKDQEVLWQALARGEIGTISTDHCSFNYEGQKTIGKNDFSKIPNGIAGVEHRGQLIYTYGVERDEITVKEMSELLSTNVAKLFGMYPQKGALKVGSDADLVLWNPDYKGKISQTTHIQNVDYTPYEGMEVTGRAEYVYLEGELVVCEGEVIIEKKGKYIHRESRA